jgi:hypothetical protein
MRATLLLALLPALVGAQAPQAAPKPPYHLRVVLHVAPHRSLTPLFQEQLRRELGDRLRLALGPLAHVEVARNHELLRDIDTRGLKQVLDGYDRLGDQQLYFVLLSYAGGAHHLEARGHDGSTGQPAPLLRRASTYERGDVAELAAQLVEKDFAPVGTVSWQGDEPRLTLRGGALAARRVKAGAVFAVTRVVEQAGRVRAERVPFALLELLDVQADGACRVKYWHRFTRDEITADTAGSFRAVRLPTLSGPVRLRLLDDESFRPLDGMALRVSHPRLKKAEELATRYGLAASRGDYPHFAHVQVGSAERPLAQFAVPILDDHPVDCRIKVRPEAEALAPLEHRRDQWLRRVDDGVRLANFIAQRLQERLKQSLPAALAEGEQGLKTLSHEVQQLDSEHDELRALLRKLKTAPGLDLGEGVQSLEELRKRRGDLQAFVQRMVENIKADEETQRLQKLVEQARLLEAEADYDKAIELFKQVLASRADAKVKEHLGRLEKQWQLRGDEHARARKFIYETWPALEVGGLKQQLDKARASLQACKAAGDALTPLRLQRANAAHAAQLKRQRDALKLRQGQDNLNQLRALGELADELLRFHAEVAEAIREP